MCLAASESSDEIEQLRKAYASGPDHVANYLERYRGRLRRLVSFRMDELIRSRVDPSDVIQEASLEAFHRVGEFLADPAVPFFVWVRYLTLQKLEQLRQHHLRHKRNARLDRPLHQKPTPNATSIAIASQLLGDVDTPSAAIIKDELRRRTLEMLSEMSEVDREILAMRHFEQLKNREVALILGITESAAAHRYYRALEHLRTLMLKNGLDPQGLFS